MKANATLPIVCTRLSRLSLAAGFALISLAFIQSAIAASYTWNGSVSSDWYNPTNWTPQGTPGTNDTATISTGTVSVGTAGLVGTLNVSGSATVNATAGLTAVTSFDWTGGSVAGLLTVASNATFELNDPGGNLFLYNGTLVNNGTAVWNGGTIYFNAFTMVTNNGSWLAQTDDAINNGSGGSPTFYNNGAFKKSPATGTTAINSIVFSNTGSVDALTGTINFDCSGFLDGTFSASAGAQILFTSGALTYGPNVNVTGAGLTEMTGGSLTLTNTVITNLALAGGTVTLAPTFQNGAITNLTMLGGTLSGTNTVTGVFDFNGTINGALTVAAGASCFMTNLAMQGLLTVNPLATLNIVSGNTKTLYGSTVVNNGTVAWSGGVIYFNAGTIVTNNGTWLAQSDSQIYNPNGGSPTFYNNGSFTKSPTTGTTYIESIVFNNTGTVDALSGTINFSSQCYLDGTFSTAAGAQILFSGGTYTYGPQVSVTGSGLTEITGGGITLTNTFVTNLVLNGGTVSLAPTSRTAPSPISPCWEGRLPAPTRSLESLTSTVRLAVHLPWPRARRVL